MVVKFPIGHIFDQLDKFAVRLVEFLAKVIKFRAGPWGYLGVLRGCSSSIEQLQYSYLDPMAGKIGCKNGLGIAPVANLTISTNMTPTLYNP
jgi:hypothetical protein